MSFYSFMSSKKYRELKEKAPTEAVSTEEAVEWLKSNVRGSFDETIEVHVNLGIDAEKSDQMVRGQLNLPSGAIGTPEIVVFTEDSEEQKKVKEAGAKQAGGDKLIDEISESGVLNADIAIATPAMMPKVAKVARILGPKGLMPNPKTGTVAENPVEAVNELMGGKISYKMDQAGNIHQAIAKVSWEKEEILANIKAFIQSVREERPAAAKGELIKAVYLKSTMSPSIKVTT